MENLYLIKCNEFYKIGIANNLQNRIASLQTGNPYPLVVEFCFEFPNAGVVEKALHQKFAHCRTLGEWFELLTPDLTDFVTICRLLGGRDIAVRSALVAENEIEEAEEIQEVVLDDPEAWDFAAMFRDGWQMHRGNDGEGRNGYWCWRKRKASGKGYVYGGRIADLPFPSIEEMRRIFRDGKLYQPYIKELGELG